LEETIMPIEGPRIDAPFALSELLTVGLDAEPSGPAIITLDGTLSWAELDEQSTRVAQNYLSLGLSSGERVATLMPNRAALMVHHLACLKAGLVSAPLNYRYTPTEIDHALRVSGASLLVHHVERDEDIDRCDTVPSLRLGTVRYADDGDDDRRRGPTFADLLNGDSGAVALPTPRADSTLFVFFTSGSTGPAKGVTHTVDTIGWMVANLVQSLEVTPDEVVLTTTSHSYLGGTSWGLMALAAGAPLAMATSPEGSEVLPLIRSARPALTWMLPSTLYALLGEGQVTREDFDSFRYISTAGDKASGELERRFADLAGYEMVEVYGMTEAIGIAMTPPSGPNKQGSTGPPGAGVTLSVRDDDGSERPDGEVGRLWIRYRGTMVGYWDHPEATDGVFSDGWFDTGDLVRVDGDGYVWFTGRRKQIIVHDGSNIAPQEVEDALVAHPAVARAGVVGIHDLRHGENVWAYVALQPGVDPPSASELISFAADRVGYKAPEVVEVLDQIPVNAVGKTDRTVLKKMAAERHDTDIIH
jgi:long-chain acyl-CoA synthetase